MPILLNLIDRTQRSIHERTRGFGFSLTGRADANFDRIVSSSFLMACLCDAIWDVSVVTVSTRLIIESHPAYSERRSFPSVRWRPGA